MLVASNGHLQTVETPKIVMLSGEAFFLYFLGFLGLYFWTRTDYKHYSTLFWIGTSLLFMSGLGLQLLWNIGNS